MRVQFDATIDEMVDVHLRSLAHSKVLRAARQRGRIVAGLLAAVLVAVFSPVPWMWRIAATGLAAVAAVMLHPYLDRWFVKRRLRKFCVERVGSDEGFSVEVEISPEGIRTRQLGVQSLVEWPMVDRIEETAEWVQFLLRPSGIVVVRSRAFDPPETKSEFADEARRLLAESPGSPGAA